MTKTLKKTLAIVVALALCLSAFMGCFSVSAEGNTVTVTGDEITVGDTTAEVKINIASTGFAVALLDVAFTGLDIKADEFGGPAIAVEGTSNVEGAVIAVSHNSLTDGNGDVDVANETDSIRILVDTAAPEGLGHFTAATITITFDTTAIAAAGTYTVEVANAQAASAGEFDMETGAYTGEGEETLIEFADATGDVVVVEAGCKHANVVTDAAVAPTCTETGLTEGSHCGDCGEVLKAQEEVPMLDHVEGYDDITDTTHDVVCTVGGEIISDNVPHYYEEGKCACGADEPVVEPDCEHANATRVVTTATISKLVFTYTCPDCAAEPWTEEYDVTVTSAYKFGHTLEIQNDITLRFRIVKENLKNYSDIFTVFDKTDYSSGTATNINSVIWAEDLVAADPENPRYVFAYTGVEAKMLNDNINAKLYAKGTDGNYYCYAEDYSVISYVNTVVPSTNAAYTPELKTALMDMVNYGSYAQIYFSNYNIANKAIDAVDAQYHSLATTPARSEFETCATISEFEGSIVTDWKRTLECLNKVVFNIRMVAPEDLAIENYKLKIVYKDVDGNEQPLWVDGASGEIVYKNSRWQYSFDKLAVMQFSESFTAVLCDLDGNPVSTTRTDSIEDYVSVVMASSSSAYTTELKDMLKYMITYGDSAKAYFESTK